MTYLTKTRLLFITKHETIAISFTSTIFDVLDVGHGFSDVFLSCLTERVPPRIQWAVKLDDSKEVFGVEVFKDFYHRLSCLKNVGGTSDSGMTGRGLLNGQNHSPAASLFQTLSHSCLSQTPHFLGVLSALLEQRSAQSIRLRSKGDRFMKAGKNEGEVWGMDENAKHVVNKIE